MKRDNGSTAIVLSIAWAVWASAALGDEPGSDKVPPAAPAVIDDRAVTEAKRLIGTGRMLLTSDDRSAANRFCFSLRMSIPARDKAAKPLVTEYLVARRGDRAVVLARSAEGLPYCYMGDGLVFLLDHQNPGQVLMSERGQPLLTYGVTKDGQQADFWVGQDVRAARPAIRFDPGAQLASALDKVRGATLDAASGTLALRSEHSRLTVVTVPAGGGAGATTFPIRSLAVVSDSGIAVEVTGISADADPPVDLFSVNAGAVTATGLPVRPRHADEPLQMPMAPVAFADAAAERAAALRLNGLFPARRAGADVPGGR